jgi:hypothetical protein
MTFGTTTGPRLARGPVGILLLPLVLTATPAHAVAGTLDADCRADRSGAQTLVIAAYARVLVEPGVAASRIAVMCTVKGRTYGFASTVEGTSAGLVVVATGMNTLVGADQFQVCYSANATFVGGGTATFPEHCV